MVILMILLDYVIRYYLVDGNVINYIEPCFFISLIVSYMYFYNSKKSFIYIILIAILYDLFFSSILFITLISFYLLYYFIYYLKSKYNLSFITYFICLILGVSLFYFIKYILLLILGINVNISWLGIYIIKNVLCSFIIGLLYYYFFAVKLDKKY